MSSAYVCQTCGGTYSDTQRDGTVYFHACPTVFDLKVGVDVVRPDARDENIRLRNDGQVAGVKADGRGVKRAIDGAAVAPAWLQKVAAQAAKEE